MTRTPSLTFSAQPLQVSPSPPLKAAFGITCHPNIVCMYVTCEERAQVQHSSIASSGPRNENIAGQKIQSEQGCPIMILHHVYSLTLLSFAYVSLSLLSLSIIKPIRLLSY